MEIVPPSAEFMKQLSEITEQIRADWLKDASEEAREMYAAFLKKVQR
jgi:hypothetical protein